MNAHRPSRILPVIVFSQFAGTSLWFAGNAILPDIQDAWNLGIAGLGWMSSSVQLGFITGTFLFAFLSFADRYSAKMIFLICAVLGGLSNIGLLVVPQQMIYLLILRFLTGFFLAGIYPVGMKIAAEWYTHGLGRALGFLVGALVLGTAFPHLIRGLVTNLPWEDVIMSVSLLAILGGLAMYVFVPQGPFRKKSPKFSIGTVVKIFKNKEFRNASFGYFGHMWELYALWTFVPFILMHYQQQGTVAINTPVYSFLIIGIGSIGCIVGGYFSNKYGSSKVAMAMLLISGACCLFSPFLFHLPFAFFISFLAIWGFSVVGDSPQFSTLNAKTVDPQFIGTGLTIVTSIGFLITIGSIELLNYFKEIFPVEYIFLILLPGPIMGFFATRPLSRLSL